MNRFLHAHLALALAAGSLVLLTPDDGLARGAAWWVLHAVLYAMSLSSLLLGWSAAHADAEEWPFLLTLPVGPGAIVAGKLVALAVLVGPASLLLVLPVSLGGGWSPGLAAVAIGAAGVTLVCASLGLVVGLWVHDGVRGLIAAIGGWLVLLFGTDLFLLAVAGAPFVQQHADVWIAAMMLNPLDALRVAVLFAVEGVAFSGIDSTLLASWWVGHAWHWLAMIVVAWCVATTAGAWRAVARRTERD